MASIPSIRFDSSQAVIPEAQNAAVQVLQQGVVHLRNVFPRDKIECWENQFRQIVLKSSERGEFPYRLASLGEGRNHYVVEIHKAFNDPAFYANPLVYNIARILLEDEFILMTCAMAYAEPGAIEQYVHRDQPLPFSNPKLNSVLPPFSLTVAVPLVSTNDVRGGTEIIPGSHLEAYPDVSGHRFESVSLDKGDCLVWDSRCIHRGRPNHSECDRPMLLFYYQRPWFFNFPNYGKDSELKITREALSRVPEQYLHLLEWVHRVFPAPDFRARPDGRCSCGSGLSFNDCHGP